MTVQIRDTKVTSNKNVTVSGVKANFQLYLVNTYKCSYEVAAAWTVPNERHELIGIKPEHYSKAVETFIDLPKEIVL